MPNLGLASKGTITGAELETLDDDEFDDAAQNHTIFARISPEQKARLIASARRTGRSVGFLGDGVNDALALHAADVGISVDTATDVAKDAADVVLLEKDLGVLADGVAEGRRIFANTIKYVLMGTSSNFGNMFSAAARLGVPAVPADAAQPDPAEQPALRQLASWRSPPTTSTRSSCTRRRTGTSRFIRRFMLTFGPISSLFDFLTFGLMLGRAARRAGRVPHRLVRGIAGHPDADHLRHPHPAGARSSAAGPACVVDTGHLRRGRRRRRAHRLAAGPPASGSPPLPWQFFAALVVFTVAYLVLVEMTKKVFYAEPIHLAGTAASHPRPRTSHPPPRRAVQPQRLKAPAL